VTDRELTDDYVRAGFLGTLGFGERPALIIVDFARAYLEQGSPLYAGVEKVLETAGELLAAARAAHIPIVHTRVEYVPGGRDGGLFYQKVAALRCFERGSPLGEFAEGLEPIGGEVVVTKQYASAFFGTSLASTLTSQGIDTLLIAGLTTSGCVRATAVDAIQHGFRPIVVSDAVGDRDSRPHEANLFDLEAKYADLLTTKQVAKHLRPA
jgi:nicotinamidase-related amidase